MDHCEVATTIAPVGTGELTVGLAGMPNSGKTTLMNALTGGSFRTGNYPGVTVSLLRGRSRSTLGETVSLVDLPGVHSTIASSPEEELSTAVILGKHRSVRADVFISVVDATQIERHLRFAAFVARQQSPMVIALTMMDLLPRVGLSVDVATLEAILGVKVVPVDARTGQGAKELLEAVQAAARRGPQPSPLAQLPSDPTESYRSLRRLLEDNRAVTQTGQRSRASDPITDRVDRIVLHRLFGFPIFFVILAGLFAAIFWAAQPLMDWIDAGFAAAGDLAMSLLGGGLIARFVSEESFRESASLSSSFRRS